MIYGILMKAPHSNLYRFGKRGASSYLQEMRIAKPKDSEVKYKPMVICGPTYSGKVRFGHI